MKSLVKLFSYAMVAAAVVSSCAKVEEPQPTKEGKSIIGYTDPDTKTALNGRSITWLSTDKVRAFGYLGSYATETTTLEQNGSVARFKLESTSADDELLFAVYPEVNTESEIGGNNWVNVSIPTIQNAVKDGFMSDANIAIAAVEDGEVAKFKNATALLSVQVKNDDIRSIKLSALSALGEGLSGKGSVKIAEDKTVATACDLETEGADYVQVDGEFENGGTYYFVVYPLEYTSLTLTFTDKNGRTAEFKNTTAGSFARNSNITVFKAAIPDTKWETPSSTIGSLLSIISEYDQGATSTITYSVEGAKVVAINGKRAFLEDETGVILYYSSSDISGIAAGDYCNVTGSLKNQYYVPEIVNGTITKSGDTSFTPDYSAASTDFDLAAYKAAYQANELLSVELVSLTGVLSEDAKTLVVGDGSIPVNVYGAPFDLAAHNVTIAGYVYGFASTGNLYFQVVGDAIDNGVPADDGGTKVYWNLAVDQTDSATETEMSWISDYATMKVEQNKATTPTNNYYPGSTNDSGASKGYTSTRLYKSSKLTITPVDGYTITAVEFAATTNTYAAALKNSEWTNASSAFVGDESTSTTISVTPQDGEKSISAVISATTGFTSVKVYYSVVSTAVTSVSLDKTSETLVIGDNLSLSATVYPSRAENKQVTWSSSNSAIASVSNDGQVTAISAGSATITAKTVEGGYEATCEITVNKKPSSISIQDISGLSVGSTTTISAQTTPESASLTYSIIEGSDYISISGNVITASAAGTAKVQATFAGDDTYSSTTKVFKVVVGSSQQDYDIVFKTASTDGSIEIGSSTKVSTVISEGVDYVSGFTASCSKAYYNGVSGVKLGTKSVSGTFELELNEDYTNLVSITVYTAQYGSDAGVITVSAGDTNLTTSLAPGSSFTHSFESAQEVSKLKFSTSTKRAYISKITITVQN